MLDTLLCGALMSIFMIVGQWSQGVARRYREKFPLGTDSEDELTVRMLRGGARRPFELPKSSRETLLTSFRFPRAGFLRSPSLKDIFFRKSKAVAGNYILVDGENVSRQVPEFFDQFVNERKSKDAQVVWFCKSRMHHRDVEPILRNLGLQDQWIGSIRVEMDCDIKLKGQDLAGAACLKTKGHHTVKCQYDNIYDHDHCSFDDMVMMWFAAGFARDVQVHVVSADRRLNDSFQQEQFSESIFRIVRSECSKEPSHRLYVYVSHKDDLLSDWSDYSEKHLVCGNESAQQAKARMVYNQDTRDARESAK